MAPQNRSWRHRADLSLEARLHRLRFAPVRNHGEDFFCLENLSRRHRNGSLWYLRYIGKPCLANLLVAARFIELDDNVGLLGIEIGGGGIYRKNVAFCGCGGGGLRSFS